MLYSIKIRKEAKNKNIMKINLIKQHFIKLNNN